MCVGSNFFAFDMSLRGKFIKIYYILTFQIVIDKLNKVVYLT